MKHLHPALPQTFTPETLAKWITENAIDVLDHEDRVELTKETIKELEHKSSVASRAIDQLEDIKKEFMDYLTNGTTYENGGDGEAKYLPQDITIPPTKGLKILKENRKWADTQLRNGFRSDVTKVYVIPFAESRMMIAFDVEGNEMEQYSRPMKDFEIEKYGLPIIEEAAKPKKKKNVDEDYV